jgi:hypothetical protein
MAEDQPGPPGSSNHDDQPGQRSTEPLGGPAQPPQPPPAYGQPGSQLWPPATTAPLPGDQPASPAFAAAGPPREALRRGDFASVGDLVAAIGRFISAWNQRCQPFVWTKDADTIGGKLNRTRTAATVRSASASLPP